MLETLEPALADDLTGLLNRRYLRELFRDSWSEMVSATGRVSLLLVDLDGFKQINDRFGHLAGDAVLRAVAHRLRTSFRDEDRIVRYGGDEFVVVLVDTGPIEARALAERARRALAEAEWVDSSGGSELPHRVSFSYGIATAPDDGLSGDEVVAVADRRLYAEKMVRRAAAEQSRRRRRYLNVALAATAAILLGLAVGRLAGPDAFRWWRPVAPEVGATGAPPVVDERSEMAALREEVERLNAALQAAGPSVDAREALLARIHELEARLAEAERTAPAASGSAPAAGPSAGAIPTADGLVAGQRVSRAPGSADGPTDAPGAGQPLEPEVVADAARAAGGEVTIVSTPPQLIGHDRPVYPPFALQRGIEGEVELRVRVGADGRVLGVEPTSPQVGFGFDEAARRAALSATYTPAQRDGRPVAADTLLRIRFVLASRR